MRSFDVEQIRADFPILERQVYGRPLVYLDNAATAQKPRQVVEAMERAYLNSNGNVHRAEHRLAEESTALYEQARETVKEFIGAESTDEIIFTSGATASLNIAARGLCELLLKEGDNVVVSEMEHHSNIVPWQLAGAELRVLPVDDHGHIEVEKIEKLIDSRTKIAAITQCSNVLGTRPDIREIVDVAHSHGAIVVVDGCQGVVHGGVDVRELGCDMYAFSGHKLYGPPGIGVLYGKRELLERMPPFLGGGDMVDKVTFEKTTYAALPFKFEAGTANYVGAIGMAEAMKYLAQFDPREVEAHENLLLEIATAELSKIPELKIYGSGKKAPIVSFTIEGIHPSDIGAILDKQGIAIRTGTHCAQPLMTRFGVETMCRASFALYNTEAEAFALAEGVKRAVSMLK